LPHSRVMIHQPSGGAQGVATDGNQLAWNVETERWVV
jgi:ATP-dependent protease ClpP protease subunit